MSGRRAVIGIGNFRCSNVRGNVHVSLIENRHIIQKSLEFLKLERVSVQLSTDGGRQSGRQRRKRIITQKVRRDEFGETSRNNFTEKWMNEYFLRSSDPIYDGVLFHKKGENEYKKQIKFLQESKTSMYLDDHIIISCYFRIQGSLFGNNDEAVREVNKMIQSAILKLSNAACSILKRRGREGVCQLIKSLPKRISYPPISLSLLSNPPEITVQTTECFHSYEASCSRVPYTAITRSHLIDVEDPVERTYNYIPT